MKKISFGFGFIILLIYVALASDKIEGVSMALKTTMTLPNCSPEGLPYGPFAPYCATVEEKKYLFATKCELAVVKQRDILEGGYGYRQKWEGPCVEPQSYDWTADGVTFNYPDQKITIPAGSFMGGR